MPTYYIKTVVHYEYEVEADSEEDAAELGWMYENYPMFASVYSVDVEEQDEEIDEYNYDEDEEEVEDV
jgi:hypothetical protein